MKLSIKCGLAVLLVTAVITRSVSSETPEKKIKNEPASKPQPTKSEIGAKKILVLLPISAPSHHNVFSALTDALLERGHYVTIVSSRSPKIRHPHQREIKLSNPFDEFFRTISATFFQGSISFVAKAKRLFTVLPSLNRVVFESPEVLALKDETFDLVITETFFFQEPLLGFAHHFGCPSLTLHPSGYASTINELTGGSINPSYVANVFKGGVKPVTFLDRLINTVATGFTMIAYHWFYYPRMNAMMQEVFPDAPPLYDLINNVSLTLINNHDALMYPVALSPSMIQVGGMHIKPGKPLPEDLKKWIEDAEHGIVYFSLGSNLGASALPQDKRDILFASFAKLKQRVLVKWDAEVPENAPKNCRFEEWVPQQEVLAHPKLKAFMTHGGLLSTQESVYYGAPLVGMPVFADQFMNMEMAVYHGFAVRVSIYDLSEEALDAALHEVITNPKYREQSQKLSARFRSDPVPSLEKAVYYTELLMKFGDMKHLQPGSVHLYWYQYMLLDVAVVLAIGAYISWRILRCVCSTCLGCCRKSSKSKKD